MYEEIGEKIKVRADFDGGLITPRAIKWQGRTILIEKVNLVSQEREGKSMNYYFAVETDKGNVLKLKYNNEKLIWVIEELWIE
ncbi:MAG: hypothetical protein WC437_00280 [Patescibacteria group bacterium]|jgi:outer membrane translocation and assembly module TamA